jgi:hypothetical protein
MKMMVDKLYDQQARGFINDDWAVDFIVDMHKRIKDNLPMSEKQQQKVEDLFERW